jgi:hypothetical protein
MRKNFSVGSANLSDFFSAPYRTETHRPVAQQIVYRFKKYHTIKNNFVLRTRPWSEP